MIRIWTYVICSNLADARFLKPTRPKRNIMLVFSRTAPPSTSFPLAGTKEWIEVVVHQTVKQRTNPWVAAFEEYYRTNPPERHLTSDEDEYLFDDDDEDEAMQTADELPHSKGPLSSLGQSKGASPDRDTQSPLQRRMAELEAQKQADKAEMATLRRQH